METQSQQIILYNSRWQQETDRILSENPEFVLYFIVAAGLVVASLTLGQKFYWKVRWFFRKNRR